MDYVEAVVEDLEFERRLAIEARLPPLAKRRRLEFVDTMAALGRQVPGMPCEQSLTERAQKGTL